MTFHDLDCDFDRDDSNQFFSTKLMMMTIKLSLVCKRNRFLEHCDLFISQVIWLIRVHHGIKVGVKKLIERFTDTPGQEGV